VLVHHAWGDDDMYFLICSVPARRTRRSWSPTTAMGPIYMGELPPVRRRAL